MHLHTTGLFINNKSYHANYELDLKMNILMNELTFLDLSKNANHSLTQSRNQKIKHLPEKSTYFLLF